MRNIVRGNIMYTRNEEKLYITILILVKQNRPMSCYYQLLLLPLAEYFLKFSGRNEFLANFSSLVSPVIFTELSIPMNVYGVTTIVNIGRNNVALFLFGF